MKINWAEVETILTDIATVAEKLAPIAGLAGPIGVTAANVIDAGAQFAAKAIETVQAEQAVLSETNLANIQAAQLKIQAANDALAAQVDKS